MQTEKHNMKTYLLLMWSLIAVHCASQTYVYNNERMYFDQMLCSVQDGHVLPGHSNMWSDAIMTASNNKIFKGFSTISFDVLYTIESGKLYVGESTFSMDQLYTIKNGKIYRGDSTMMMDCLFTYDIKTNKLYKGDSTFPLDAVLFLQGAMMNDEELFALLLANKML
jgi:hypothetical protein